MSNKRTRYIDNETLLAEKAARNFLPMQAPDVWNWQKSAFAHGYTQALMDLQDGKIQLPEARWK